MVQRIKTELITIISPIIAFHIISFAFVIVLVLPAAATYINPPIVIMITPKSAAATIENRNILVAREEKLVEVAAGLGSSQIFFSSIGPLADTLCVKKTEQDKNKSMAALINGTNIIFLFLKIRAIIDSYFFFFTKSLIYVFRICYFNADYTAANFQAGYFQVDGVAVSRLGQVRVVHFPGII